MTPTTTPSPALLRPLAIDPTQNRTKPNSLFEAVPGQPDLDVAAELSTLGEDAGLWEAVTIIFQVAESKPVPGHFKDKSFQVAAAMLLAFGQGPLLLRLAAMAPWPSPKAHLHLRFSAPMTSNPVAMKDALRLAQTTAPGRLKLTFQTSEMMRGEEDWKALAALASIGPGTELSLVNFRACARTSPCSTSCPRTSCSSLGS